MANGNLRTRAQRMVHVPIISNFYDSLEEEKDNQFVEKDDLLDCTPP